MLEIERKVIETLLNKELKPCNCILQDKRSNVAKIYYKDVFVDIFYKSIENIDFFEVHIDSAFFIAVKKGEEYFNEFFELYKKYFSILNEKLENQYKDYIEIIKNG